ncbi:hypothetical protein [Mariniluteicoccus endophyticus]
MTNAPVNHVDMTVVIDDLPPLMRHAELGCSLRDAWTRDRPRHGAASRPIDFSQLADHVLVWSE